MDLFVYGTLRDHRLMAAVAGQGSLVPRDATLDGYRVRPLNGHVVPFIEKGDGTSKGILWSDLSHEQAARLNLYEAAFGYSLTSINVTLTDGQSVPAKMYLPPANVAAGHGDWSLEVWQSDQAQAAIFAATEIFSHDPRPTPAVLGQMWNMINMRAWARVRAMQERYPATVRTAPAPQDITITPFGPPQGAFFRLQAMDVTHTRFDGDRSGSLRREVFMGIDAVLVLPYDPARDRILLVEQARMGAAARGDTNPWVLEPVAGMIDAGETPQEAALRETAEEAGITQITLQKINAFYPSPGSSTDYFHTYLGLCDLPDTTRYSGGLATEAEDLRLHPMSFDDGMRLVETGEVTAGPLMMMMYWLALHRDSLRRSA